MLESSEGPDVVYFHQLPSGETIQQPESSSCVLGMIKVRVQEANGRKQCKEKKRKKLN